MDARCGYRISIHIMFCDERRMTGSDGATPAPPMDKLMVPKPMALSPLLAWAELLKALKNKKIKRKRLKNRPHNLPITAVE